MSRRHVPAQLGMFEEPQPADPLVGLPVLVRSGQNCFSAVIEAGKPPHAFGLRSSHGKFLGWVSKPTADFIRETVRRFGAGGEPLTICVRQNPKGHEMRRSELFPSRFLKAEDFDGQPQVLKIVGVTTEELGTAGKKEMKPLVRFAGMTKGLILNVTNFDAIAEICGSDETDDWSGKHVELYPTRTEMGGKQVDAIRVRAPRQRLEDDLRDEIPF